MYPFPPRISFFHLLSFFTPKFTPLTTKWCVSLLLLTLFPTFGAYTSLIIILRLLPPNTNSHVFTPHFLPCSTALQPTVIVNFVLLSDGLPSNSSLKCLQFPHSYHLFHLIVSLFPYLRYTVPHNFTCTSLYNTQYFHNSTYDYYKSQNEEC